MKTTIEGIEVEGNAEEMRELILLFKGAAKPTLVGRVKVGSVVKSAKPQDVRVSNERNLRKVAKKSNGAIRMSKKRYFSWTPEERKFVADNLSMKPKVMVKYLPRHPIKSIYDMRRQIKMGRR